MSNHPDTARKAFGDIAPALADYTDRVLFGDVWERPGLSPRDRSLVTFEPGARSNWHTHKLGQTLIVISGLGWHQCEGEAKEEIRPGDVITCAPGKRHWHGATATTAMSHIAIAERDGHGKAVAWMEPVSDAQYLD